MLEGPPVFGPPPPAAHTDAPTRFVSDTLWPLAGGQFTLLDNKRWGQRYDVMSPQMQSVWDKILGPGMVPAGQTIKPDTVEVYQGAPDHDHTMMHESGHIWDNRNVAPDVQQYLTAMMPRFKPQSDEDAQYARTPAEYHAEAFSRALKLLRKSKGQPSDKDLAKLEQGMPGASAMVDWMRTRPPFGPRP